jgi:hypothetical protein
MQARMQQAYRFAVVTVALVVVLGGTALAQSSNPHIGPSKMNVAKTKFNPGPAPTRSTTTIEAAGAGVKYTVDQASADGSALHWGCSGNYDGKDNAVTGENPNGDMVALTRVNPTTVTLLNRMGGKVTVTQTSVVSSDGKTRTLTTTGMPPPRANRQQRHGLRQTVDNTRSESRHRG